MQKKFASQGDLSSKKVSFTEIGSGLWAYTAEGDPNTGVIIGDESVMIFDAQATPLLANRVIEKIRTVTDKPISHVVLSHYHAVRVLGASAYGSREIIMSEKSHSMVVERGKEDWESEYQRFPRLFEGHESIPGLTQPTTTFKDRMTVFLGKRRVNLMFQGRAHTAGDIVAFVPDQNVMFTGDIVEHHSACYCGDAHLQNWPFALESIRNFSLSSIAPGRGNAIIGETKINEALENTKDFVKSTYRSVAKVAQGGGSLKEAMGACREVCDPKFGSYAIYEHCLPFNVARAYDEALGIDNPRIWTDKRDLEIWEQLQS